MVVLSKPPSADLRDKRVLLSAGETDPIIPAENAQRLAVLLEERGADVTFELQQASHGLVRADIIAARHWLAQKGVHFSFEQ